MHKNELNEVFITLLDSLQSVVAKQRPSAEAIGNGMNLIEVGAQRTQYSKHGSFKTFFSGYSFELGRLSSFMYSQKTSLVNKSHSLLRSS